MASRRLEVVLDLDTSRWSGRLATAGGQLRTFGGSVGAANTRVRQMGDSFNRMGSQMASPMQKLRDYVLILGNLRFALLNVRDLAVGWVTGLMKQSGEVERLTVLMRGLSKATTEAGKADEARQNLTELMDLARKTGFELGILTDAFIKFKSADLDPRVFSLKGLADAVASFGGTSDTMHRASIAIQQMAGKGVISMEELRQQLGEAVPTAMKTMAAAMGKTVPEFTKMVAKGQVAAKPALKALLDSFEIQYAGAGQRIANSLFGQIAQLKTNLMTLATDFSGFGRTDGLFAGTVNSLKELNELMRSGDGRDFMRSLGNAVAEVGQAFANTVKFVIEWRSEIGTAAQAIVYMFAALQGRNLALWIGGMFANAGQQLASFRVALGEFGAAWGNLGKVITGQASVFTTASSRQLAAVRGNIEAAKSQIAVAQQEVAMRTELATATERYRMATMESAFAAQVEVNAARGKIAALEAERLAQVQSIDVQRKRVVEAQAAIMFAQRDIDLKGRSKATTDALARANNNLSIEEGRLAEMQAERAAIDDRLAKAQNELTVAEETNVKAKRDVAVATRQMNAANAEAVVATEALKTAEVGAAIVTEQLTLKLRAQAMASQLAASMAGLLKGAMSLLFHPVTMVVGALAMAAYQAGWFATRADQAAAAADRLAAKMGNLADVKETAAALEATNAQISKMKGGFLYQAEEHAGFLFAGSGQAAHKSVEKLEKEAADLREKLAKGRTAAFVNQGEQDWNAIQSGLTLKWNEQAAGMQKRLTELQERITNGGPDAKAAFAEQKRLMDSYRDGKIAADRAVLNSLEREYEAAKSRGDKENMRRLETTMARAREKVESTSQAYSDLNASAAAAGNSGAGAGKAIDTAMQNMAGRVAQATARMNGLNGELAKLDAQIAAGKFKGQDAGKIAALRDQAAAIDAVAAAKAAAAEENKFDTALDREIGKLAQLKAQLNDMPKALARFQAMKDSGAFKDWSPTQIKQMEGVLGEQDKTQVQIDDKRIGERLDDEFAKARVKSDELWNSIKRGTYEADQRAAQLRSRFEGMLDDIKDPTALENAKKRIEEIVGQFKAAQAADTVEDWRKAAEDIQIGLMNENDAREANFQRELQRQQILLDEIRKNASLSADAKMQAEQRFQQWRKAAEQRMARESESSVYKMARDWAKLGQNIDGALSGALSSFVDGMFDANFNFGKFAAGLIKQIVKIIIQAMIAYAILSAIGMANNSSGEHVSFGDYMKGQIGGGFGLSGNKGSSTNIGYGKGGMSGSGAGTGFGLGGGGYDTGSFDSFTPSPMLSFGMHHTGGLIGQASQFAQVSASLFAGAPKYHGGGWIGGRQLKPGEVPIIGMKGEAVLTEGQQRAIGRQGAGMSMPQVQVNIINNSGTEVEAEHGEPEFNGKEFVLNVVLEASQKQGPFRDALTGMMGKK